MSSKFNFLWVHINSEAKAAFLTKLNNITSNTSKSIKYIGFLVLLIYSNSLVNPLRNLFCHWLRSHWIPWFVIYHDTPVKLTEKVVSFLPIFLQICFCWFLSIFVFKIVFLWSFISIKIIFVRFENSLGSLNDDNNFFWLFLIFNL